MGGLVENRFRRGDVTGLPRLSLQLSAKNSQTSIIDYEYLLIIAIINLILYSIEKLRTTKLLFLFL